jgi:2-polyprenyl-3-methyl-5-hydroxy-6-metoxy-1,4-benzoquinol methylase
MTVSSRSAADRDGAPYEHAGTYAFDPEWAGERERLALLEAYCDPHSRQALNSTGVGRGWTCLDVGAGAGSIARWLGRVVGDPGRVVALDLDGRFAAELEPDGIAVARADVRTWQPAEPFDLVHARFLLVHLPDRDAVLRRLLELVRPGGWLVVTECTYESWAWDPASPYGRVAAAYVARARGSWAGP